VKENYKCYTNLQCGNGNRIWDNNTGEHRARKGHPRFVPLREIALPKTKEGRYTPSSLVEPNRGANERGDNRHKTSRCPAPPRACNQRRNPAATAEFRCVLGLREYQHYPPSWVEATTSPGQVVTGSATPAGASQWNSCRTGSRAFAPGSRGYTRPVRDQEQTRPFLSGSVQTHSFPAPAEFQARTGPFLNPTVPPIRASPSRQYGRRCP
jgi:hypothetical protein